MLNTEELNIVLDEIYESIKREIFAANRSGDDELNQVLSKYGYGGSTPAVGAVINNRSMIIVVGDMIAKEKDLIGVAKKNGVSKERIVFLNDYDKLTNFNVNKLTNINVYSDVLVGPTPHKLKGLGKNQSLISEIEQNSDRYPHLIKLMAGGELKITKSSFEKGLKESILYKQLILNRMN